MNNDYTPKPTSSDCDGLIHPKAALGLELFNTGQYWYAHEVLEEAWLEEPSEVRHLYRGILQAGIIYLHIERNNYRGALKVYHRSQRWLSPFPNTCRGINVGQLKADLDAVIDEVRRLGPDHLDQFNNKLFRPIKYKSGSGD